MVFSLEHSMLRDTEEVDTLTFQNHSGLRGGLQFALSIYNIFAGRRIRRKIRSFKPDVIHLHNWHFSVGPIAIRIARQQGIPLFMTVHNYRLLCPSATLLSNGELFMDSVTASFPWKAVRKGIYRNSIPETFWLSFIIWFHKKIGTWKMVSKYIVLTDFAKDLFQNSSFGIPAAKFVAKPNFLPSKSLIRSKRETHFLFIGRLSEEKGIRTLLAAFENLAYELRIAGDGPLANEVLQACKKNANITFLGNLDKEGVERAMQNCTALVFPSIWYEGMPMTLLEAFASGTPVIGSRLGAIASLVKDGCNGLHFGAGNREELMDKLKTWQELGAKEQERYRNNAYDTYSTYYTPEKNKKLLLDIYKMYNK